MAVAARAACADGFEYERCSRCFGGFDERYGHASGRSESWTGCIGAEEEDDGQEDGSERESREETWVERESD